MTLEQAFKQVAEAAARVEIAVADAKAGYSDVLRQVMAATHEVGELRREMRANEAAALVRHDELLGLLRGNRG